MYIKHWDISHCKSFWFYLMNFVNNMLKKGRVVKEASLESISLWFNSPLSLER